MKNLLEEKPTIKLHGRLRASVGFVADADLKNKKVLDIGCGYGWCELNLLGRGVKKISAIEISKNDLVTIRQNIKDERLTLKTGSATKLPFEDELFNTVVSWEVIEHIPKNTEFIMFKEVYRVLKPEGKFYLSTPNKGFFANILDPAWWFGHRHYSVKKLCHLAQNTGFEIIEVKIVGGWWTIFSTINLYLSKWVLRRERLFNKFFNAKEDQEFSSRGFANIFIKFRKHP